MTDRETLVRIGELERKVDHIYRHLTGAEGGPSSVPPLPSADQSVSPAVRELVQEGNKIGAIKRYRAETGTDLATAQDFISRL